MRKPIIAVLIGLCCLNSCQSTVEEEEETMEHHQPVALDYTLLGVWPSRVLASRTIATLEEAGIGVKPSGYEPCLINVEHSKLGQAHAILSSDSALREGAQIKPHVHDIRSATPTELTPQP